MKPLDLSKIDLSRWNLTLSDTMEKIILSAVTEALEIACKEYPPIVNAYQGLDKARTGHITVELPLGRNEGNGPVWSFLLSEEMQHSLNGDRRQLIALRDDLKKTLAMIEEALG